jgi:hypothetical protein
MASARQTRIVFWTAICASCVWLIVAVAIGAAGIVRFSAGGFGSTGRAPLEILIVSGLTLLPLIVFLLIVRAIRRRSSGLPWRIIARALYPLIPVVLLNVYVGAVEYLGLQFDMRLRTIGSTTYVCSKNSITMEYDPAAAIDLRLTERRHPGKVGTWIVAWPGKKPIEATSFPANTGSIGGSQGLAWREPDGRHMTAYLSFSDLVGLYGPAGMWLSLVPGDQATKGATLDATASTKFTCGLDLKTLPP